MTSHDPKRLTNEIHENEGNLDLQKDSNNQKKGNYNFNGVFQCRGVDSRQP